MLSQSQVFRATHGPLRCGRQPTEKLVILRQGSGYGKSYTACIASTSRYELTSSQTSIISVSSVGALALDQCLDVALRLSEVGCCSRIRSPDIKGIRRVLCQSLNVFPVSSNPVSGHTQAFCAHKILFVYFFKNVFRAPPPTVVRASQCLDRQRQQSRMACLAGFFCGYDRRLPGLHRLVLRTAPILVLTRRLIGCDT